MIVTLAEVKANLQITDTTYDAIIQTLIPQAESLYRHIRGIDFFSFSCDGTTTTLSNLEFLQYENPSKGAIIESVIDDGTVLRTTLNYLSVENETMAIEDSIATPFTDIVMIWYPLGAQFVASKIIEFLMSKQNMNGLKSENIGNYSYTKEEMRSGLPLSLYYMITSYQVVK